MPQVFHPVGSGAETCRHAFLYADLEVVVEHYVPCTRNALGHVVVETLPADEDGHVVAREDDFGQAGALRKRHSADRSYAVAEFNRRDTGAVESDADTIEKIVEEMMTTTKSERTTRVIDFDQDASMEQKKREGYF